MTILFSPVKGKVISILILPSSQTVLNSHYQASKILVCFFVCLVGKKKITKILHGYEARFSASFSCAVSLSMTSVELYQYR